MEECHDVEGGQYQLKSCESKQTSVIRDIYVLLDLELGPDEGCGSVCQHPHPGSAIPLFKYSDIPGFLQGNPWVVSGYRATLPFNQCCRSVFMWNNETINIWSHLAGCFIFFILILHDNLVRIPLYKGSISDHVVVTAALMCFMFCMLCSAGYHTFMCHSERASHRWLAFDLTGISVGLIGCYIPGVHYAFYCLSVWRDVYLLTVTVLFGAVLLCQTTPRYHSAQWFYRRVLLYMGLVAYGVVPTVHWVFLSGGLRAAMVQIFLPKVTVMYILAMTAFAFYITKFPERIFPGTFDYIGSSHQWWHVLVVITFLWWHQAGAEILQYYTEQNMCHI